MQKEVKPLTERQAEVKRHLEAGLSPRQIAGILRTSTQYVYEVRDRLRELGAIR